MKKIGAHVSVSGGVEMAPVNALGIGADAFALFTKNQRQWVAKPLSVESVTLFKENCEKEGFDRLGNPVQTLLYGYLVQMTSGMKIQHFQS